MKVFCGWIMCLGLAGSAWAATSPTLEKVKAAGELRCGVDFEEAEYTTADAHGNHSAFDLDLCKAVAVAVLGPGAKFVAVPFRDEEDALKGLKTGEMALLATGSLNYMNQTAGSFGFTRPVFHDDQAFMVNAASGIRTSKDLAGKKVCYLGGTEYEAQALGYLKRQGVKFLPFSFQEEGEMEAAFITGNCAAVTADLSQLAYERIAFKGMAKQFVILPETVAKDPLAMVYRADDPQWGVLLQAVADALVQAEESGVTQANVAEMTKSDDLVIARLLGTQRGYGQYVGLDDAWAMRVIAAIGNYGELYERDLGSGSPMRLTRGRNELWTRGGLMVASPVR